MFTMLQTGEFDYPIVDDDGVHEVLGFSADYSEQVRESFCTRYPSDNGNCTLPLPNVGAKTLDESTHAERTVSQQVRP